MVTFKKCKLPQNITLTSDFDVENIFIQSIKSWLEKETLDTNEIFLRIMKMVFADKILIGEVDLLKILTEKWLSHNELTI